VAAPRKSNKRRSRTPAAPRVGLFGLLGQGNLGNDGSMEAVLAYLRSEHPQVLLDCLCTDPEVVRARYDMPAAQLRWYGAPRQSSSALADVTRRGFGIGLGIAIDAVRIAAWVRRHDAVAVPGMGVLETTVPMRPWKTPYWMFLLCASGRIFGTRIALVSVGANVTDRRATRFLITRAVRLAHYRSYRDEISRTALQHMGVDTSRDIIYPDVAYALPTPAAPPGTQDAVGIGVMDYSGGNDELDQADQLRANYLEQVKLFCKWLLDNGRPIRLFTSDTADEPVVQAIAADVRAYRPDLDASWVTAEPARSLSEVLEQISLVSTVVATRYHNVLYALLLAKPTLALGYAVKHEQLMTKTGLPEFCLPCRSLEVSQIIDLFAELERRSPELTKAIAQHNAAKQELVARQLAEMSAVLLRTSGGAGAASDACRRPASSAAR